MDIRNFTDIQVDIQADVQADISTYSSARDPCINLIWILDPGYFVLL